MVAATKTEKKKKLQQSRGRKIQSENVDLLAMYYNSLAWTKKRREQFKFMHYEPTSAVDESPGLFIKQYYNILTAADVVGPKRVYIFILRRVRLCCVCTHCVRTRILNKRVRATSGGRRGWRAVRGGGKIELCSVSRDKRPAPPEKRVKCVRRVCGAVTRGVYVQRVAVRGIYRPCAYTHIELPGRIFSTKLTSWLIFQLTKLNYKSITKQHILVYLD